MYLVCGKAALEVSGVLVLHAYIEHYGGWEFALAFVITAFRSVIISISTGNWNQDPQRCQSLGILDFIWNGVISVCKLFTSCFRLQIIYRLLAIPNTMTMWILLCIVKVMLYCFGDNDKKKGMDI